MINKKNTILLIALFEEIFSIASITTILSFDLFFWNIAYIICFLLFNDLHHCVQFKHFTINFIIKVIMNFVSLRIPFRINNVLSWKAQIFFAKFKTKLIFFNDFILKIRFASTRFVLIKKRLFFVCSFQIVFRCHVNDVDKKHL